MVKDDLAKLTQAYNLRGIMIHQLQEQVSTLEAEVMHLKELLKLQKDRLFGQSSESSRNLNLSSQTNNGVEPTVTTVEPKVTTVSEHTRTIPPRGSRQLDKDNIPKYTIVHDLPQAEQICACCGEALHIIGQDTSKQLEIIPVQYCLIMHTRLKYGCRSCDSVIMAPKPQSPLPKAIAGSSLLADVALNKYQYHLPLYRQSKIMKSRNVTISDKTLANWVMNSGTALLPIYDAIWVILKHRYLQVDETPVKVQETNKKGYVWAYFAPNVGKGLVAFDFSLTREGFNAQEKLKNFKGLLQTDGYAGYDALRKREDITGFGCLIHARRKFSEIA